MLELIHSDAATVDNVTEYILLHHNKWIKIELHTKVKKQQDGLIALVKKDDRFVSDNDAPVWTTEWGEMRICLHLQDTTFPSNSIQTSSDTGWYGPQLLLYL